MGGPQVGPLGLIRASGSPLSSPSQPLVILSVSQHPLHIPLQSVKFVGHIIILGMSHKLVGVSSTFQFTPRGIDLKFCLGFML